MTGDFGVAWTWNRGDLQRGPCKYRKGTEGPGLGNRAGQTCATSVRKATLSRSRKKTSAGRSRSAEKLRTRMPAPRPLPPVAPGTQQHPGPAPRLPAVSEDSTDSQRQPAAPAMAAGPSRAAESQPVTEKELVSVDIML